MKIKKVILVILLSSGYLGQAVAELPKNIRLGTEASYAPFESKTPKGDVVGFDIDLANEMCKRMNVHCTIVETEYDALIPSLKARKIDAVIAAMSITPKRLKEIDFTDKLYAANSRLIAPKGSSLLPDVKVLQGKRVGVLQGSIQDIYANKYWRPKGVDVVTYPSQDIAYSDLASGRLDATFQDEVAGSYGFLKQPVGKEYSFAGSSVKDLEIFGPGTGIGLRKGETELQSAFNTALQSMLKDGTYKNIADKYFDFDIYSN